ncbi:hypothetical protein [Aquabacterium sp. OR-4]|uniref:hypothetical protein n=1 Tax=Aquabacterium sp. OR-4 TaxID=2978127 RepID=UPI0028CB0C4F|nr:hypothetical protein [Aquabacterium sp. OR-4]MDT7839093.1 hypothetical protein [Aquabacterium sp. OR-4]
MADLGNRSDADLAALARTGGRLIASNSGSTGREGRLEQRAREAAAEKVAQAKARAQECGMGAWRVLIGTEWHRFNDLTQPQASITGLAPGPASPARLPSDFQSVNDRKVAVGTYDRWTEMGTALKSGDYQGAARHFMFTASDDARAQLERRTVLL